MGMPNVAVNDGNQQTMKSSEVSGLLECGRISQIESIGALTTVGAGVLTAALIAGGIVTRSGPAAVFNDTTGTAADIIAALGIDFASNLPNRTVRFLYLNTSGFAATILAGTGVTLSGTMTVATVSWRAFLLIVTGRANVSLINLGGGAV